MYSEETEQKAKIRAERQQPTDVLNVKEEPSSSEGPIQKRPAKKHVEEGKISSKDNDIFGIRERTTGEKTGKSTMKLEKLQYGFSFRNCWTRSYGCDASKQSKHFIKLLKFYDDF